MIATFDAFGRYEMPEISLCSPSSKATYVDKKLQPSMLIGAIQDPQDFSIALNFNAPADCSFEIDKNTTGADTFDKLATKMGLYIEGFGYFIIDQCTELRDYSTFQVTKSISAQSAEVELYQCEAPYIDEGTYPFVGSDGKQGIIDMCAALSPKWKFRAEHIEESLKDVERFFSSDNEYTSLYEFLINCLQDRYDCYFEFDIINREVHIVSKATYVQTHDTDIHLSHVNVMKSIEKVSSEEDIYTALRVSGGNDLGISLVNPIGTNIIYDFNYRKEYMSDGLREALNAWEETIDSKTDALVLAVSRYAQYSDQYQVDLHNLNSEQERLAEYQKALDNFIRDGATDQLGAQKALIAETQEEVKKKQEAADLSKGYADTYLSTISTINAECALGEPNFTDEQLEELAGYIYTGEYSDEDITQTDEMTTAEIIEQQRQLMAEAQEQMKKFSTENFKFTLETDDFLFDPKFSRFAGELEAGSIVYAESSDDVFEQYHVSSVEIDFEEKKATLVFSNKYNKYDIQSLFEDVMGSVSKSASSLKRVLSIIEDQESQLRHDADWIENAMKLTASHVLESENQEVIISGTGYWGRTAQRDENGDVKTDQNGNILYDPEQIKIINNGVYITNDNWSSVATAIGKTVIGNDDNGNPIYQMGVIGNTIIGKILIGKSLYIEAYNDDEAVSTIINKDGIQVYNGGIKIYSGEYSPNIAPSLSIDENGNLVLKDIKAESGTIGGWTITGNKMYAGDGSTESRVAVVQKPASNTTWVFAAGGTSHSNYEDCPFRVDKYGKLYATGAEITGNFSADSGTIGGWEIYDTYISSSKDRNPIYIASGSDEADYWIRAYNNGVMTFSVSKDGILRATGAEISGTINAKAGEIGGCTISEGVLQVANANIGSLSVGKLTGGVNNAAVTFNNATVKGTVNASSGNIGGWQIDNYGENDVFLRSEYTDEATSQRYTIWLTNWGVVQIGGVSPRGVSWVKIISTIGNEL